MANEVVVEYDGPVAVITLNRPEARNAVNLPMARQLADALDDLDADSDAVVGIVTGAGGTFCAGMDLKAFVRGEIPSLPGRGFAGIVEAPPRKPLIAAVEGFALAGGCEIVLACDLVVAASDAHFGLPEVKRGLLAAGGGLVRLPRRVPAQIAMEVALTGEPIGAPRAAHFGLVNRLTPSGEALATARDLAAVIAANGPLAVTASKQIIVESADWASQDWPRRQGMIAQPVVESADAREGATAFAEKRAPVWRGA